MRKITVLTIFSVMCLFTEKLKAEEPDSWAVTNVRSDDVLNMRISPDYRSEKVGEIPFNGTNIKKFECVGDINFSASSNLTKEEQDAATKKRWCKVVYQNFTGWVNAYYLEEDLSHIPAPNIVRETFSNTAMLDNTEKQSSPSTGLKSANAEEEKLSELYEAYLLLKSYHEINQDRVFVFLVSDSEMDEANSSMAYIEQSYQKNYPEIDTDKIWNEVSEKIKPSLEESKNIMRSITTAPQDMTMLKVYMLNLINSSEQDHRKLNNEVKLIEKDF